VAGQKLGPFDYTETIRALHAKQPSAAAIGARPLRAHGSRDPSQIKMNGSY
jgi:hypothetical protein